MLLNIKFSEIVDTSYQYTKILPLALGISLLFIFEFFTIVPFTFNDVSIISYLLNLINNLNTLMLTNIANILSYNVVYNTINPILAVSTFTSFTQIQALGINLYTFGSMWLIITSVILLLAMIAPIFVSRSSNISQPHFLI